MPYIPEDQRDTSYYIFHKLFHCRVRYIDSLTIEELREYGMPTLFEKQADEETARHLIDCYISINDMVEYFKNGINVRVVTPEDTEIIYKHIENHLIFWKNHLERSLNTAGAPLDDLVLLDKFAHVVYDKAKYYITEEYLQTLTGKAISNNSANAHNFLKSISKSMGEKPEEERSQYNPMADLFNSFRTNSDFIFDPENDR